MPLGGEDENKTVSAQQRLSLEKQRKSGVFSPEQQRKSQVRPIDIPINIPTGWEDENTRQSIAQQRLSLAEQRKSRIMSPEEQRKSQLLLDQKRWVMEI